MYRQIELVKERKKQARNQKQANKIKTGNNNHQ
jgi:hypothetical protein